MNRIHQTHIRLIRLIRIATKTHKIHQANATHERISCSERPKLLFSLSLICKDFSQSYTMAMLSQRISLLQQLTLHGPGLVFVLLLFILLSRLRN